MRKTFAQHFKAHNSSPIIFFCGQSHPRREKSGKHIKRNYHHLLKVSVRLGLKLTMAIKRGEMSLQVCLAGAFKKGRWLREWGGKDL